ncbi:hypothetical protein [Saccharicrinis sp. 156]|uniref:hypothetical protein n=1 Tax=Saccharicrinis sp. 156 TaxID=3417574 RepID=UPI003D32C88D
MEPMTFREFLIFIFSSRPFSRLYYRKQTRQEVIKEISSKLTHNDDIEIRNQDSKKFVGCFIPKTDDFKAKLKRKAIGTSFTLHQFINIYGTLKEEHDLVTIEIEYKQSKKLKTHKVVWAIVFVFIFSRVAMIEDVNSFLIVLLFIGITLAFILMLYNSILRKQIDYTEKHLVYNE